MAIIINEFEVVPEAAPPPPMQAAAGPPPPMPGMTDPEEVRRILLRQAERVARVWAD